MECYSMPAPWVRVGGTVRVWKETHDSLLCVECLSPGMHFGAFCKPFSLWDVLCLVNSSSRAFHSFPFGLGWTAAKNTAWYFSVSDGFPTRSLDLRLSYFKVHFGGKWFASQMASYSLCSAPLLTRALSKVVHYIGNMGAILEADPVSLPPSNQPTSSLVLGLSYLKMPFG
jgi:hypothetical protein